MPTSIQKLLIVLAGACVVLLALPADLSAQAASAAPSNKGFVTVKEILDNSCSACHDWTSSWETVTGGGRVVPGSPEKSVLYQRIASDQMPKAGDKLTPEQKAFIRGWIAAGAPATDLPITVPVAEPAPGSAPAGSDVAAAPAPSQAFLFFPSKVAFHEVTGFTATALFFGAGALGVVHFLDMMSEGHLLRDSLNPPFQEGGPESTRIPLVQQAWGSDSALRWWHVGFIVGGEVLYLGDAVTGISMMTKGQPGKLTRADIHRAAFFTHVSLMAAQIALGFFETSALSNGNHDLMIGLGAAHAAIGVAIPLVMLGAGLENVLP
jgi:hypothetical protein